jgi:hypothetical protein
MWEQEKTAAQQDLARAGRLRIGFAPNLAICETLKF